MPLYFISFFSIHFCFSLFSFFFFIFLFLFFFPFLFSFFFYFNPFIMLLLFLFFTSSLLFICFYSPLFFNSFLFCFPHPRLLLSTPRLIQQNKPEKHTSYLTLLFSEIFWHCYNITHFPVHQTFKNSQLFITVPFQWISRKLSFTFTIPRKNSYGPMNLSGKRMGEIKPTIMQKMRGSN